MDTDSCILAVIYVKKQIWDHFIIQYDGISWVTKVIPEHKAEKNYSCGDVLRPKSLDNLALQDNCKDSWKTNALKVSVTMNGHVLSYFVKLLKLLCLYRKLVIHNLESKGSRRYRKSMSPHSCILLKIHLVDVDQQVIDKIWNEYISHSVAEHCELDHAMSWLSTLGGAFSALGDYYLRCAETAGQISLQQWRLAVRLGDPNTVARCRLFGALSLMQTGHLRAARKIIWRQYQAVKNGGNGLAPDTRLARMCHGCWAKLRYEYQQRRHRKQNPKALHWKTK